MTDTEVALTYFGLTGTFILVGLTICLIPAVIAFRRGHPNRWVILVVCIVFGATGIGWLVALIWALQIVHLPSEAGGTAGGQSGLNVFANDVKRVAIDAKDSGAAPSPAEGTTTSRIAELEKLIKLREGGFVTAVEYDRLKRELLRLL
jgi:hypothetical protein